MRDYIANLSDAHFFGLWLLAALVVWTLAALLPALALSRAAAKLVSSVGIWI